MTRKLSRLIGGAVFAAGCLVASPGAAVAQTADKPASLSGTWNMSLIGDHVIPVALVLEQNGAALRGTFILMGKDFPLTGEVAGGKITLTGKGPAFGRAGGDHNAGVAAGAGAKTQTQTATIQPGALADMTIVGDLNADGGMAGDIKIKMPEGTGSIKWSAERLKERKVPASQAAASEAVNLNGTWKMAIVEAQLQLDAEFHQDGAKVTGVLKSDHLGDLQVEGTYASGVLSFVATGSAGGQDVRIEFSGKSTAAGALGGDLVSQMGPMTWTAERIKK
ncbi:MAG: hypothetical protein EPO35_01190 [Acidobacteria bacterium]|nr:MAG: hypothetical protein EPO35_01190 [Acidobacteriota bacterium]